MNIPTSIHAAREMLRVKASGNEFIELVHAATNEDPWGPTGTQMDEVCRAFPRGSYDIMEEIKLRLKHREKAWRPCYKSLLLLDHLARNVPESGLPAICSVMPTLRVISQSFYYTGSKGTDHGLSVRERAKKLCDLLSDGSLLREEREKAAVTRMKLSGVSGGGGRSYTDSRYQGYSSSSVLPPSTASNDIYEGSAYTRRTKEEQERYDMELAARLQREEESRAGMSVMEAERMFNRQVNNQPATVMQAARNSDIELARRLEEEERRHREGRSDKTLHSTQDGTNAPPTTTPPRVKSEAPPSKPEPPKTDVLDDLFAPTPVATTNTSSQQPGWSNSIPFEQHSLAPVDAFDVFLDARVQQQQQHQGQMYPTQFQPPQPQQQQQQMSYGGFQPAMAQPQQYPGVMSGGGGNSGAQTSAMMLSDGLMGGWSSGAPMHPSSHGGLSPQGTRGVPPGTNPTYTSSGPQGGLSSTTGAGNNDMQGWGAFTSGGGIVDNMSLMEQQMAQFAGKVGGQTQQQGKSLDVLMAERRDP